MVAVQWVVVVLEIPYIVSTPPLPDYWTPMTTIVPIVLKYLTLTRVYQRRLVKRTY